MNKPHRSKDQEITQQELDILDTTETTEYVSGFSELDLQYLLDF